MDRSITMLHLRYLWSVTKYYGQELLSNTMTSSKVFTIGIATSIGCHYMLSKTSLCPPLFQSVCCLALTSCAFESVGLLLRALDIYMIQIHPYFVCEQDKCKLCAFHKEHVFAKIE